MNNFELYVYKYIREMNMK